jgi:hypothetical protein
VESIPCGFQDYLNFMPAVSLHMCALLWAANRRIRIPAAELRTLLQVMTRSLLEPIHPPHRPLGALLK